MVSSLILLRSLRVYTLKQLFFSISVNSGFRNIYLPTSWLGKYLATIEDELNIDGGKQVLACFQTRNYFE